MKAKKIIKWLEGRKEYCAGCAEQAPHTAEAKHLLSEARKYDNAERIIRAAEQLLASRSECQTRNVVGFPQIDHLEQLLGEDEKEKEIKVQIKA